MYTESVEYNKAIPIRKHTKSVNELAESMAHNTTKQ